MHEYGIIEGKLATKGRFTKELNERTSEGWELVGELRTSPIATGGTQLIQVIRKTGV